jgi:hypothetical protein
MNYIFISLWLGGGVGEFGKIYFSRVSRIIFQWSKVMCHQVTWHACILRELTINDP